MTFYTPPGEWWSPAFTTSTIPPVLWGGGHQTGTELFNLTRTSQTQLKSQWLGLGIQIIGFCSLLRLLVRAHMSILELRSLFFFPFNEVIWRGTWPSHWTFSHIRLPVQHALTHAHSWMKGTAHTGGSHYLIGLCQLGELLLGFGIILVRVWVVFFGKLREETVN